MRHHNLTLFYTTVTILALASLAPAQDLKLIKRRSAEIQMFATTACLGDDNQPVADANLTDAADKQRLSASESDLLAQLTTLKKQASTLNRANKS